MTTLGIVQVDKVPKQGYSAAERMLDGKPLIEWVVRRASESQRLDAVIVALDDNPLSHKLSAFIPPDIPVYLGSQRDVLRRFVEAARQQACENIVRLGAESPFTDAALIDRLITTAEATADCDYATYCQSDGSPAIFSPLGMIAEWFTFDALRRADREATDDYDRQRVTRYIVANPDKFTIRLAPLPAELDRTDIRLTVDSAEDWELTEELYEALGPEQLDWQRIAGFLQQQPSLRERMAVLNRQSNSG